MGRIIRPLGGSSRKANLKARLGSSDYLSSTQTHCVGVATQRPVDAVATFAGLRRMSPSAPPMTPMGIRTEATTVINEGGAGGVAASVLNCCCCWLLEWPKPQSPRTPGTSANIPRIPTTGRNRIPDIGPSNVTQGISFLTRSVSFAADGGDRGPRVRPLRCSLPVQGRDNPDLLDQGRFRRRRPRGLDGVLQPHDFHLFKSFRRCRILSSLPQFL